MSELISPLQYGHGGNQAYSGYYQHTGKITAKGILSALAIGLPTAVILGVVYAYSVVYIAIVQANFLLCCLFGMALGFAIGRILRWGKVRNIPVSMTIVGVVTSMAYYVCWVVWLCVIWDQLVKTPRPFTYFSLAAHPRLLWEMMKGINEVGTWSTSHNASSVRQENEHGQMLWMIWASEALAIFATAIGVVRKLINDKPYCEKCDAWCEKAMPVGDVGFADTSTFVERMVAHDFGWLNSLGLPRLPQWIALSDQHCAKCKELHTISATIIKIQIDRKGRQSKNEKPILKQLLLTADEITELSSILASRVAQAQGDEPSKEQVRNP